MPPATGLRERKKERTKAAMIDAALALFAEHGYDAVTVQDIAAAAEVSATTFFRYFATKEEVLYTDADALSDMLERAAADLDPHVDDLAAVHHLTRTAFGKYFDVAQVRARYRVSVSTPDLRGLLADSDRRWRATIAAALQGRHGVTKPTRAMEITIQVGSAALRCALDEWIQLDAKSATDRRLVALIDQWFAELRTTSRGWTAGG